jgi:hypothetical protein
MKKVFLILAMVLVSVLAKAESTNCTVSDIPVRETIGTVK